MHMISIPCHIECILLIKIIIKTIDFSIDQNKEHRWNRHVLLYRKMAHAEWNGRGSCQYLMSSFVNQAKKDKIK